MSLSFTQPEGYVTVTNTYHSPQQGRAVAEKIWLGGSSPRPTICFKLYRQVEGGAREEAPLSEAPLKELTDGMTEAVWTELTEMDKDGKPYSFSVEEVDSAGVDLTPESYEKAENGLTVTNRYVTQPGQIFYPKPSFPAGSSFPASGGQNPPVNAEAAQGLAGAKRPLPKTGEAGANRAWPFLTTMLALALILLKKRARGQ